MPSASSFAGPALLVSELRDFLDTVREEGQGAPLLSDVRSAVSQGLQSGEQDLGELEAVGDRLHHDDGKDFYAPLIRFGGLSIAGK